MYLCCEMHKCSDYCFDDLSDGVCAFDLWHVADTIKQVQRHLTRCVQSMPPWDDRILFTPDDAGGYVGPIKRRAQIKGLNAIRENGIGKVALSSAQVRIVHRVVNCVAEGDYKATAHGLSEAWVPVRCHAVSTECTFGIPVFDWKSDEVLAAEINSLWQASRDTGRFAAIGAYSLGKAQRVMTMVDPSIGPILTHGAIENTNAVLRAQGVILPDTIRVTADTDIKAQAGGLIIAPPSALAGGWIKRFGAVSTAFASGWMALRGVRRRRAADRGFVVSDHADWKGLNAAVRATGATRVFATHGYTTVFRQWLEEQGYDAQIVQTEFGDELLETEEAET